MESVLEIISFLMTPAWQRALVPEPGNIPVYIADKKLLETIVGFRLHQGVMAVARVPDHGNIFDFLADKNRYLLVALDGIVHAENVGVVVRNCAAFGVDAVLASASSASPYLRRAVRNSMGAAFRLPVFHVDPLEDSLRSLQHAGARIYAADPAGEIPLADIAFAPKTVIVFGSEGEGVSKEVLKIVDARISIPMKTGIDSINVASASSVILYEASKENVD
jgi:tRNA G18 (ribose-2'-O)-methylase SpoU